MNSSTKNNSAVNGASNTLALASSGFTPGGLKAALAQPGWAIVTATQESLGSADRLENVRNNLVLEQTLVTRGTPFVVLGGKWLGVDQGRSFLILAGEREALGLARRSKQDAIVTSRGIVYADGRVDPADHARTYVGREALARDGYSTLPPELGSIAFSLHID